MFFDIRNFEETLIQEYAETNNVMSVIQLAVKYIEAEIKGQRLLHNQDKINEIIEGK